MRKSESSDGEGRGAEREKRAGGEGRGAEREKRASGEGRGAEREKRAGGEGRGAEREKRAGTEEMPRLDHVSCLPQTTRRTPCSPVLIAASVVVYQGGSCAENGFYRKMSSIPSPGTSTTGVRVNFCAKLRLGEVRREAWATRGPYSALW